jgi:hypothetical protein
MTMADEKRDWDVHWLRSRGYTLRQVGKRYGVTPERVRQIELRAMRRQRISLSRLLVWVSPDPSQGQRCESYIERLHAVQVENLRRQGKRCQCLGCIATERMESVRRAMA